MRKHCCCLSCFRLFNEHTEKARHATLSDLDPSKPVRPQNFKEPVKLCYRNHAVPLKFLKIITPGEFFMSLTYYEIAFLASVLFQFPVAG